MKKLITALCIAFISIMAFDSCSIYWGRRDVFISYDQLGTDAAFKKFKQANKQVQAEILNNLLEQAEKEYKRCESVNELNEVREKVRIIGFMNDRGRQSYIAVTKRVRELEARINGTIAEVTGQTIIQLDGGNSSYRGYNQPLY